MSSPDFRRPIHSRIDELIARAAALPAGERDVFLSRECGEDQALRQQIYDHLIEEAKGVARKKLESRPGPVTSAVQQALAGSAQDRRVELLGKVVGDYRLTAIIGAGGVGTVYLGERADRAYSAQVAIKVVANAQLSHEVQRRFLAERQILANLNHPYIGRLLDAGETFFDEPFLVMEYVHGEAMDRYCNNQRLSGVERIQLFLKVCDAVQYAHRNLIVHRDLKPGNILVSKEGIPKLLDFGIAKLLDESAQVVLQEGVVAHTRVHDRLLTPEYASPEQIRGLPVTTASDVYSLGVILYELLTGVRPYAVNAQNQLELERSICIQDPIKPSQMVTALSKDILTPTPLVKDASLIPVARNTAFPKLITQLKGDLDAIVMKALRKEPEHRYGSVDHLIEDLNRYLTQEPVSARQGNRWYHTQRFVRRHTVGVLSATAALLSLIAVAIILSIQAHQLKQQRDLAKAERDKATQESQRAETVSNFMLDVFTAADPFQSQDKQVTAKELLDKAANKIETSLNDQPEVKARLLEAMGNSYMNQRKIDDAIKYLQQSLDIERQLKSIDPLHVANLIEEVGKAHFRREDIDIADKCLHEAKALLEKNNLTNTKEYLEIVSGNASFALEVNDLESAATYYQQAIKLSDKLYGHVNATSADLTYRYATTLSRMTRFNEAEEAYRDAVKILHMTLPAKHPQRVYADISFGNLLFLRNRIDEASKIVEQGLEDQKSVLGEDSPELATTYGTLAAIRVAQNRLMEAEKLVRTGLSVVSKSQTKANKYYDAIAHLYLSEILLYSNKRNEGLHEAEISSELLNHTVPQGNPFLIRANYVLAWAYSLNSSPEQAQQLIHQYSIKQNTRRTNVYAALYDSLMGRILLQFHNLIEARKYFDRVEQMIVNHSDNTSPNDRNILLKREKEFKRCEAEHRLDHCELTI